MKIKTIKKIPIAVNIPIGTEFTVIREVKTLSNKFYEVKYLSELQHIRDDECEIIEGGKK